MKANIDLLLWHSEDAAAEWRAGGVGRLSENVQDAAQQLARWVEQSSADYLLLWAGPHEAPERELLESLIEGGVDLAHSGLSRGLGEVMRDLRMVMQDWGMINAPCDRPSSSWRVGLDACLVRRKLLQEVGGLDAAFISSSAAGLELGYRCLKLGALVEHRPELWAGASEPEPREPPRQDLYTFILRHYGERWARYVLLRRGLRGLAWRAERAALEAARGACRVKPAAAAGAGPVWYAPAPPSREALSRIDVSVIVPTLGRYPYLPDALDSLRRQTVKPREVVVVDQNPPQERRPDVYEGYEDLNLRVIWQDERGQSLARNAGLAAVGSRYVFLFDDDSIAHDDLIEAHLRLVVNGPFDASTGVAYPPPPADYQLPPDFRYPRLSRTFDTGNSLLPVSLARRLGGLDRNYDFGPGTDADFGTRLYLAGYRIAHNPAAARIHFKAPMGGLRTYGAHKYNTDAGLLSPFPPVTQSYYGLRYLDREQRLERSFLQFATAKIPRELRRRGGGKVKTLGAALKFAASCALLPLKLYLSTRKAASLAERGACLARFDLPAESEFTSPAGR